jgi:hypothetical protein
VIGVAWTGEASKHEIATVRIVVLMMLLLGLVAGVPVESGEEHKARTAYISS